MLPFPKTTVWIGSAALLLMAIVGSSHAVSAMGTSRSTTTTTPSNSATNSATVASQDSSSFSSTLTQTEANHAKLWNRFAKSYAQSPIGDRASYETKLAMTRRYLSPTTTRALEFGCGTGGTALFHAPYVQHCDAIDVSSRMIEIALAKQKESNATNVYFSVQGIDSFRAPDASYDVILGLSILHLLPNRIQAIQKVHRLLKPGGVFISSTPCLGDMGVGSLVKYMGAPLVALGVIPKVNVFDKATLRRDLETNGFAIEEEFHPGKDKAVFYIAKKVLI